MVCLGLFFRKLGKSLVRYRAIPASVLSPVKPQLHSQLNVKVRVKGKCSIGFGGGLSN